MKPTTTTRLYKDIKSILEEARQSAYRAVNFAMVMAYWEIGKRIVEHEQAGDHRANYGSQLLKTLSEKLTADFGKGFDERNLRYLRQFYLLFPIRNALRSELGWTHYRLLLKVESPDARNYYLSETIAQNWSTRALERQIASFYYERIVSSKKKKEVAEEASKKNKRTGILSRRFHQRPLCAGISFASIRNRFPGKRPGGGHQSKITAFPVGAGKGFSFVARQKRIPAGDDHFYVDLVFYYYILKCFVLIDLKVGKLTHQDIGQMDLYVRWYEENIRTETDNPTIGDHSLLREK